MKRTVIWSMIAGLILVIATVADVVTFRDGKQTEGFVSTNEYEVHIWDTNYVNEFVVSVDVVRDIQFGEWLPKAVVATNTRSGVSNAPPKIVVEKEPSKGIMGGLIDEIVKRMPTNQQDMVREQLEQNASLNMANWRMMLLQIMLLCSVIGYFVCGIIVTIDAFKTQGPGWGSACIICTCCCTPVLLYYTGTLYTGRRGSMIFWLLSPLMMRIIMMLMARTM